MKIKKKLIKIYDPIFNQKIYVLLNHSDIDMKKFYKRIDCPTDVDGMGLGGYSLELEKKSDGRHEYVIWIRDFNWTLQDQNTLIHEIVHTIFKMWEFNSIPICKETQEFMAHSIGNVYELIARKI